MNFVNVKRTCPTPEIFHMQPICLIRIVDFNIDYTYSVSIIVSIYVLRVRMYRSIHNYILLAIFYFLSIFYIANHVVAVLYN